MPDSFTPPPPGPPLRSLFLDLNSYFASCEQQMNPELRRKPIAVVPMAVDTTFVIAASYEAKKFGVKTGTRVGDAKQMCPGLILVSGKSRDGLRTPDAPQTVERDGGHADYIRFHHRIIEAIDTVIPVHKVCSIDEMECRLLGREKEPERALDIARRVKAVIRERVGECLTCSVGLAPNRVLAKVATDMQKPDGLVMLQGHELPDRLRTLTLRDMPGIGPRMEKRLINVGIASMGDLIDRNEHELVSAFGSVHGSWWWHWLRGHEIAERDTQTRSIGHQHVLPPVERNLPAARAVLVRLLHKAAARLRQKGYVARSLQVFARFMNDAPGGRWGGRAGWERVIPLGVPTDDTLILVRAMTRAWDEAETRGPSLSATGDTGGLLGRSLLMVGVTLFDLEPVFGTTLPLFDAAAIDAANRNEQGEARAPAIPRPIRRLGQVMDRVNTTFGKGTIYPASMHIAKDSAPMRVAFSSIPDPDMPE